MILFDTETTGFFQPMAVPSYKQPHIIEFCALKLDDKTLKEKAIFHELIQPGVPIPEEITKLTSITAEMLNGKRMFNEVFPDLRPFFHGERIMVAHNLDFDSKMLMLELQRIGRERHFPWPGIHVCTVEATFHINRRRMNLGDCYELATGKKLTGAHQAENDVRALAEIVRWLKAKGKIMI